MELSFVFLFGLIIGSFLNCLIFRIRSGESLFDRSRCPKCKKIISWYDNIPVVSFLILRGRCRHCRKKISYQYPIIELLTGLLFVIAWRLGVGNGIWETGIGNWNLSFGAAQDIIEFGILIKSWLLISVMIIIFIYDLRWYEIPDSVTLPSCAIFLLINLFLGFSWLTMLASALIGGGFFLIQFLISHGRWIGGGDIRLGFLMGIALGKLDLLVTALIIAYFSGSIVGLSLIALNKKKMSSKMPLGVFLTTGTLVAFFWGKNIIEWYIGLIS